MENSRPYLKKTLLHLLSLVNRTKH